MDLASRLADWDGLAAVVRRDRATGAWIFIALDDDTLGVPTGGTRLNVYPSPADGLLDAQRLAQGMTRKWAVLGLPFGGGKAVLALERPLPAGERRALLERYGRLVESLGGAFATGEDLGLTPDDMAVIANVTSHVIGGHGANGVVTDPGPFTARGVFSGIRTTLARLAGDGAADPVAGAHVLVQGVGDVGAPLARLLAEAGARVSVADTATARAEALAAEIGAEVVAPEAVYGTPCDVYAPCAVGGTVSADTVPRLACRAVAGSANNQLGEAADAHRLHERGILYAPDYLINAGGALAFGNMALGRAEPDELLARMDWVGETLDEVYGEAAERDESPLAAADRRVRRTLERGAAEKVSGNGGRP